MNFLEMIRCWEERQNQMRHNDVEIEPRGAESRSILPRYVLKNGTACVSDIPIMWNLLHSHLLRSKIKCSSFSSAIPFRYTTLLVRLEIAK